MQDRKLTPGRVQSCVGHVKSWYKINSSTITLPYTLSRRVTRKDRSPRPEELQNVLNVADLREKVKVSLPALSGFREETLSRLRYGHVREGLEANRTPFHCAVEIEITKGKYASYSTFIGGEAADYLRLYLEGGAEDLPAPERGPPRFPRRSLQTSRL